MMRANLGTLSSLAGIIAIGGCVGAAAPDACQPLMSDIQTIGSHNSYKLEIPPNELSLLEVQAPEAALALDYAHIPITEQLNLGMRQVELDVFYDPEGGRYADPLAPKLAGNEFDATVLDQAGFKVLHVQDVDPRSSCALFVQCLSEIKTWSEENSDHVPVLILINAKQAPIELPGATVPLKFDAAAFDALDAEIRTVFDGDALISPDTIRGDAQTLRDAVLGDGWASLDQSRGKVFFALDEGQDVIDVYRRGRVSLEGLAMFVNSSGAAAPDAAYFTINDPVSDAVKIAARVREGFIVRTRADADTQEARKGDRARLEAALASGAQYVSTDYYQPRTEWSDYLARLPAGVAVRTNPLSTCRIR